MLGTVPSTHDLIPVKDTVSDPSIRALRGPPMPPPWASMSQYLEELELDCCIVPMEEDGVELDDLPYLTYERLKRSSRVTS